MPRQTEAKARMAKTRARKKPAAPKPARKRISPSPPAPRVINRELSWIAFNDRVLSEGLNPENPLLERLNFLAISASNLDEFFMVRVGGLHQLGRASVATRCPAGLTPQEQLKEIARRVKSMVAQQYQCLNKDLLPALARRDIVRLRPESLDRAQVAHAERYFHEEVFPSLSPVAVEQQRRFPRVPNLVPHLAVRLRREGARRTTEPLLAIIPLPRSWPRFFQVPSKGGYHFLLFEDIVRRFAGRFFTGHEVLEAAVFRVTRNADLPLDEEESDDLLEAMEEVLRARKGGAPVRLEIEGQASAPLVRELTEVFKIGPDELYPVPGPIDLKPFMRLASRIRVKELRYPPYEPQRVPAFEDSDTLWDAIRERDVLVHHPYDAFTPVVELLEAAAEDPQVVAIKQTLYRTSEESPIIAALERAAERGKQVTVLVELKARFDEAQNIGWARRLAEAGAQVIHGVVGLKTHAKLLMIVRREADGVRRYVHLSTGNYNDATARRYEDFGLFTCDPDFGADASNFFNAVTGYSEPREWHKLVLAPKGLRERVAQLIEREIARSSPEDPGLLILKMNSLADPEMARLLCEASQKGVRVRLCVRGICCLKPGVPGLSENIEVMSLVDRYLEHSRAFYFRNGGQEEVYLASADFMPRNLDRRLEVMFPVEDDAHRRRIVRALHTLFADNQRAWRLRPDERYERVEASPTEKLVRAQETFAEEALALAEAVRVRRLAVFRPQGPGMAPGL